MEPLSFEIVTVEEARLILDGAVPTPGEPDWAGRRQPETAEAKTLSATALKWLAVLPPQARPLELCRSYPRIGNQLAALWADPAALSDFLADLLIDKRGGRQGFPGGIALELSQLQEHLLRTMEP
ncbi:hypothetical protein [Cupriavidus basilensis]|uniref:hypothetical protein n=1 Tax=Cupriavidus basilensis TaxID=68895 RepID=UPI0020A64C63|nr:hypothetical protein [Cupriavidus basilensis]MCP3020442.1 hypothetical protein [Cupriavidus basilensis]MDR3382630.1 hypothetical protein [Cupriavidus basilensis]